MGTGRRTRGRAADAVAGTRVPACDVALSRAFDFLGKRWSGVLLATLADGPLGYAELARRVEGISDSVLSDRLTELQGAGLVVRSVDPGPPVAVTYGLSPSGYALIPALRQIGAWAADNLAGGSPGVA